MIAKTRLTLLYKLLNVSNFRKALAVYRGEGWRGLKQRLANKIEPIVPPRNSQKPYHVWIDKYDTLTAADRLAIKNDIKRFDSKPLIAVIMPSGEGDVPWMQQAIQSVTTQLYPHWKLYIVAGKTNQRILKTYQPQDERICVVPHAQPIIAEDYITYLYPSDILSEHALYFVAKEINAYPDCRFIYSDHDEINQRGKRHNPRFKPDWNIDLLLSYPYIAHLAVYRAENSQVTDSYDFVLRFTENLLSEQIRHIPWVLYHQRAQAKPSRVREDDMRAVNTYFERQKIDACAEISPGMPIWRIRYAVPKPLPLVSIIIPTRNGYTILKQCVDSIIAKTDYSNYELIIIDNGSDDEQTLAFMAHLAQKKTARIIRYPGAFNYSAINNYAAKQAQGEILCLLNNDTTVITPDWLTELVSHAMRPDVGAVGAKLLYPSDNTIQHAGVIFGHVGAVSIFHTYCGLPSELPTCPLETLLVQNYSAVTGACLAIRTALFHEVGGLNEIHLKVTANDIDLCLKCLQKGYRSVWTPHAILYHHESKTRGLDMGLATHTRFQKELLYMKEQWNTLLTHDPAYNRNLAPNSSQRGLAHPPRRSIPWREEFDAKECNA